ncbi:MAG: hypothetical protein M3Q24_00900 [bacterium]|nr:hypothetical protein [bacterium]
MKLNELDYKKLVPIAAIIFIGFLALLFYFFAEAYSKSPENINNTLGTYINPEFKVTFNYPGGWDQIGGYEYDRYEGESGFFGVTGVGGEVSLDEATRSAYDKPLVPYGKHPTLENLKVDGQPAKLIIPSEDQDVSLGKQAELIVLYPVPVVVNGETYQYFILWGDKDNIRGIIPTIIFRD